LVNGRILGISGILGGLLVPRLGDIGWRIAFLLGMAAAPFASGQVSGMFSVFGIACYLSSSKSKKSIFPLIALIAFGSCSGSRTFYITLISIILFRLVRKIFPRNVTGFWLILPIFSGSIGYFLYKYFLPIISPEKASLSNLTGRSDMWKLVLSDWSNNGLLGHGPKTLSQYAMDHLYLNYAHAHNSFLQYLWDFGLLGIFTFLAMIFSVCLESSRNYLKRDQVFTLVLTLLCIQSEPTLIVGMGVVTWFWLVPLTYVYSNDRELREVL
jgi:O-antigen ligase